MSDETDLLGGLNDLVNMADKKPAARPAAKAVAPMPGGNPPGDTTQQQILERLDGIKSSIDALRATPVQGVTPVQVTPSAKDAPVPQPRPAPPRAVAEPPKPKATPSPGATPSQGANPSQDVPTRGWPLLHDGSALFLAGAALMLAAFALGMGYGAIVAARRVPFWLGHSGLFADWIAAPAGVLLLPVIAALLYLGGRDLRKEGRGTQAVVVWVVAGVAALSALIIPFIA